MVPGLTGAREKLVAGLLQLLAFARSWFRVYGEFSNRDRFERRRELVTVVSVKGLRGDCLPAPAEFANTLRRR
ncbi:hypothetical protein AMTR_s00206p00032800 [Amborella trichopoda]|uniref:Uncharacterized protein n=1 Tax=Amborella trichopoda TaxID=13333 RepID=W1P4Z4_AMBTC|nr:hypothetical protein AMTR_s00206p00032800 [Amborella trichopoda]